MRAAITTGVTVTVIGCTTTTAIYGAPCFDCAPEPRADASRRPSRRPDLPDEDEIDDAGDEDANDAQVDVPDAGADASDAAGDAGSDAPENN